MTTTIDVVSGARTQTVDPRESSGMTLGQILADNGIEADAAFSNSGELDLDTKVPAGTTEVHTVQRGQTPAKG